MKRIFLLLCLMIMGLSFVGCGDKQEKTQLGTSGFYITLPAGYSEAEDDFDEDQVAYYYKDDESIDFDVYQWSKEDKYTLTEEAEYFASEYNTTATEVIINGIDGMKYISKELYEDYEYTVINYMFDDGTDLVELSFWTIDNAKELADVEAIINTITR